MPAATDPDFPAVLGVELVERCEVLQSQRVDVCSRADERVQHRAFEVVTAVVLAHAAFHIHVPSPERTARTGLPRITLGRTRGVPVRR